MIITKGIIAFVLGSGFVSSAIIYDGIAHRHHETAAISNPPAEQQPSIPKPHAGTPATDAGQADAANDPNAPQSTDPSADPEAQQNQDAAAADQTPQPDSSQIAASADDRTDAGEADQEPAAVPVVQHHVAVYAAPVVRVRKAAIVKVARVAPAVPVEATAYVASAPVAPPASILPTGTPITLRLAEPLGSSISQVDQNFSATLDRDIAVNGKTVIAAGAMVSGKVITARPAGVLAGESSLQLEVTGLQTGNQQFDVHTAVRTFGPSIHGKTKIRRFMKGLAKRVEGEEHEVVLEEQTAYTFTLSRPLQLQ
jgi:hypothetical protein